LIKDGNIVCPKYEIVMVDILSAFYMGELRTNLMFPNYQFYPTVKTVTLTPHG
jgi:hypothetical protein